MKTAEQVLVKHLAEGKNWNLSNDKAEIERHAILSAMEEYADQLRVLPTINLKYAVFWIGKQREVYGDNNYYVLGELMGTFNSRDDAHKYIASLKLRGKDFCTILPIYY